ncbi:MAG: DNA repair protein RadC [Deltaproteobacteria bacterium]|nr:DNA repair protein RadC [Deltaproteobacteria bacterium]
MVKGETKSRAQRSNEHRAIKDWPESERPREKLLQLGPEGLSDGELLAVLLRIGATGQSAEDLARQLMAQFNGINGIDRAHIEELLAVPGMGVAKTAQVKAAIEIGKRVRRQTFLPQSFDHAADVVAYVRPHFEGKRQECFLTILLDGQNQLLAERWIAEGIPTQATVYVRRVMEEALRVSASAFVVAHNHPSGQPKPSAADDQTTDDLKQAAKLMDLAFLDHLIIGSGNEYYSYADNDKI